MPLDPVKVAIAVESGLSAVCATCTKYWAARDRGIPGDRCLSNDGCGSPLVGDDFHDYDGPLTDLKPFCFVCGSASKYGLLAKNKKRVVGVCKTHIDFVRTRQPVTKGILKPKVDIRSPYKSLPVLNTPPIRTLGRLIHSLDNPDMYKDNWEDGDD